MMAMPSVVTSIGMSVDEVWDDTELIKAYDKAVKQWKKIKPDDAIMKSPTPGPGPWTPIKHDDSQQVSNLQDRFSTITFTDSSPQKVLTENDLYAHPSDSRHLNDGGTTKYTDTNCSQENYDLKHFLPHFPVPPMPASLACSDGTFNYDKGELPALLMSWYMSGYQAGYFDAKRDLNKKSETEQN